MKAAAVTKSFHSRWVLVLAIAAMIASALYAFASGDINYVSGDRGLVFPSANEWISSREIGLWVNTGITILIMAMMIYINKAYNIPRTITLVYALFFIVFQTSNPDISGQFFSGTLLCALIAACMLLLFSTYAAPASCRRIFLIFMLLSSAMSIQYAYAVFIPVFLIGCAQMRVFSLRSISAAVLGIITPWWILLGSGIVSPADFHLPHFISVLAASNKQDAFITIITVGLTVLVAISAYILTVLKLMTYNARTRACNGLLTVMTIATTIAIAADFTNFLTYVPLLNFCAAFFLGHLFVIRNSDRAWITIASIIIIYYSLYIWRIFA